MTNTHVTCDIVADKNPLMTCAIHPGGAMAEYAALVVGSVSIFASVAQLEAIHRLISLALEARQRSKS